MASNFYVPKSGDRFRTVCGVCCCCCCCCCCLCDALALRRGPLVTPPLDGEAFAMAIFGEVSRPRAVGVPSSVAFSSTLGLLSRPPLSALDIMDTFLLPALRSASVRPPSSLVSSSSCCSTSPMATPLWRKRSPFNDSHSETCMISSSTARAFLFRQRRRCCSSCSNFVLLPRSRDAFEASRSKTWICSSIRLKFRTWARIS
mmetsp:Transcript_55317/g.109909  ORF Transcript_55317/g.109909 Transcript_55317/m.109909 type:complete len:202 (+) Transcript_55317:151-756(+)